MSTSSVHANVRTPARQPANPTRGRRQHIAPNQSDRNIQSTPTSRTNEGNSNQLMQRSNLLAPLLSKLLQEYSQDNKTLSQLKPENQTESTKLADISHEESGESEETKKNGESSEVEESHEEEDVDNDDEDGDDDDDDDGDDDDDDDRDENNKDICKCSKTYYQQGVKFIKVEYFKGACPVGWDNVDEK